jgi:SAM-dependent MidA family methyltransferase
VSLEDLLVARIRTAGPLTVAEYMAEALLHPRFGYYATRDPLGAAGDFTTAPEISQMFGELVGLCLAQAWLDQGGPAGVTLAEAGPGRGTLMADMRRAMARVPGLRAAPHLVEASDELRRLQADRLPDAVWHARLDDLPDGPLLFAANEFLDALPVRQFVRSGDAWRERVIRADGDRLAFALAPPAPRPELAHHDAPEGAMVERCPALPAAVEAVARRVRRGGAAIWVDYGDWRSRGDTLQAMRAHAPADPLEAPGEADLTAHVDFEAVARAARAVPDVAVTGMTRQGAWLERLGITARARALARKLDGPELDAHVAAHRRLTHPAEMGDLFKAIALHPVGSPPPAGFDPPGEAP